MKYWASSNNVRESGTSELFKHWMFLQIATYVLKKSAEISMRSYVLLNATDSFTVTINDGFYITGQSSISFYINPCLYSYVVLSMLYNFYDPEDLFVNAQRIVNSS